MICIAIVHCNSIFELLPKIINGANSEIKTELLEFMTHQASIEFSNEVSKWLNCYYEYINDRVFWCCHRLKRGIESQLHQATLFVCLFVRKCDYERLSSNTYLVLKYPNIYKAIQLKVLKTIKIAPIMSLEDYDSIFFGLCKDTNEQIFEIHQQEFVNSSFFDWPGIVKKISLTAHVGDLITVGHYIRAFNRKN